MTRGWAALAICAVLVTTACAGGAASQQRPEDAVVIALEGEPDGLSPVAGYNIDSINELKIFSGLLRYGQDLSQVPELAAELPQVSGDGRTVTVRLRPDVTFHDGVPLTAEDVVFSYTAVLDPKVAAAYRGKLDVIESVQALDRQTVRFVLDRTDPTFLDKLHLGVMPQHLLVGQDLNTSAFNARPVGAGPYRFAEWRKGERLVVEANPTYVGGAPKIERVVFLFVRDENARAAIMENGTADVASVTPRLANRLRDDDGLRIVSIPTADTRVVPLPNKNPVLADPRVRRALSLAVDRRQLVDGVLSGAGAPAYGLIRPGLWAASPDVVPDDPNRARDLLDQAGWRDLDGDGVREKDGTRLAFTVTYPPEYSDRKDLALALRQDLAEVGVDVTLDGVGFEAIKARSDRDAPLYGYGTQYDPDFVVYELFHSRFASDDDAFSNPAKMVSPAVDAALEAGRSTLDRAQRAESYRQLERAVREDGSYLYLVHLDRPYAVSQRVTGLAPQVVGAHESGPEVLWNLQDWRLRSDV